MVINLVNDVNVLLVFAVAIIAILLGSILFLLYKLYRKNEFITSVIRKLFPSDEIRERSDVSRLLKRLHAMEVPGLPSSRDHLFHSAVHDFLFRHDKDLVIYLHYTNSSEVAENILRDGFKFVETFYKTAVHVKNDRTDLVYKHNIHKPFGQYVVVIAILRSLIAFYNEEIVKRGLNKEVEQVLTEIPPYKNEHMEEVYTLPPAFIKGYFDYESGTIVANDKFDPSYDSAVFYQNLRT